MRQNLIKRRVNDHNDDVSLGIPIHLKQAVEDVLFFEVELTDGCLLYKPKIMSSDIIKSEKGV